MWIRGQIESVARASNRSTSLRAAVHPLDLPLPSHPAG